MATFNTEIESKDVIRLIMQFLKEQGYNDTLATLEDETLVSLNVADDKDDIITLILEGQWHTVLKRVVELRLPTFMLIDLFEHVILELAEERELASARAVLRQTEPMHILKQRDPDRFSQLEHTLARTVIDPKDIYPHGTTKEKRRKLIANALSQEITNVSSERLRSLIEDAAKWQQQQGLVGPENPFDVFRDVSDRP